MSEILVHNSCGDAAVYTSEGRLIGPHRTATADPDDPVTLRLLTDGRLVHHGRVNHDTDTTPDEVDPAEVDRADGEQVLEEPAGNASTQDWVDYAVSQGHPHSEVSGMKRHEIQDLLNGDTDKDAEAATDETTPAGGDQPEDQATAPGGADDESEEETI